MPIHPACSDTVLSHAYLVTRTAAQIQRRLPPHVQLHSELLAAGQRGLIEAANRYTWGEENLTFTHFAFLRIQGAMYDELRSRDLFPRSARKADPDMQAEDVSEEIASAEPNPEELFASGEMRAQVQALLGSLTEVQRFVIVRYFEHGFTLAQIGAHIGCSESRVSQIKAKALRMMRATLETRGIERFGEI